MAARLAERPEHPEGRVLAPHPDDALALHQVADSLVADSNERPRAVGIVAHEALAKLKDVHRPV